MKTVAWEHNCGLHFYCDLCGKRHEQNHASVKLLDDNGETIVRDICPFCVEAGPIGTADRMREHAQGLRDWANDLEELATDIETISVENWATLGDLRYAERHVDRAQESADLEASAEIDKDGLASRLDKGK